MTSWCKTVYTGRFFFYTGTIKGVTEMKIKIDESAAEDEVIIRCRGLTKQVAAVQRAVPCGMSPTLPRRSCFIKGTRNTM